MNTRPDHESTLREIANRVADRLMTDLWAGRLAKIGIDEIRATLRQDPECPRNAVRFDWLEGLITRRLVEEAVEK